MRVSRGRKCLFFRKLCPTTLRSAVVRGCPSKLGVLKSFANLQERACVVESLFIKERLQHNHFPVKFAQFLRTTFYKTSPLAASPAAKWTGAVVRRCSVKKVFWKISQISQENTCARVSFLIRKTLAQVFSCKFYEVCKNIFF